MEMVKLDFTNQVVVFDLLVHQYDTKTRLKRNAFLHSFFLQIVSLKKQKRKTRKYSKIISAVVFSKI